MSATTSTTSMTSATSVFSAGNQFKNALKNESPLQIVGVINALAALLAKNAGFKMIYLSGAGLANSVFALPDLGVTTLTEVVEATQRITHACDLPLLVDADTGFGSILNVELAVKRLEQAGAAGLHLEDQTFPKRCGHREGKQLVSTNEMCDRLKAALDARQDANFVIMARTDARDQEGLEASIERANRYIKEGADMIFAEALSSLAEMQKFVAAVNAPVLVNLTEFGKTPVIELQELKKINVSMALYPLTAFRAMNRAISETYQVLRSEGSQRSIQNKLQTRAELYELLNYAEYESKI